MEQEKGMLQPFFEQRGNSPFAEKSKRRGEEAGTKEQRGFCQKLI
jgi:hypothetical protein